MGQDLPFPPSQPPPQSPRQAPIVQGESSSDSAQVAEEQLVSASAGAQTPGPALAGTGSLTNRSTKDCLRFVLDSGKSSFDDFLSFALLNRYGVKKVNATFIENRRDSSQRQYNSSWAKFRSFVQTHKPADITLDFCLDFFSALDESGYA